MHCASRNARRTAAATISVVLATCAHAAPVSIELRPAVQVSQGQVRLGDVAYLTTRDLPTLRRLMTLPLGAAPRPGSPVLIDRDTLERRIQARAGLASSQLDTADALHWSGASETVIESAAQQLAGDVIADAAHSALASWLSQRSTRADVQIASTVRDLTLPAGTPVLRVRPLPAGATPQRRMLVWVEAWVEDRFVRATAVSFDVSAWAPVTVASTRLDSGAAIDAVTLRGTTIAREIDLAALRPGAPVKAFAPAQNSLEASGQRLRRPLKPGEVMTDAHLEPMPAVARGNWAQLLARSGEVTVESRVEVLQDGRKGQFVRVKVPGGSGEVLARVTGPGQVEVQP